MYPPTTKCRRCKRHVPVYKRDSRPGEAKAKQGTIVWHAYDDTECKGSDKPPLGTPLHP